MWGVRDACEVGGHTRAGLEGAAAYSTVGGTRREGDDATMQSVITGGLHMCSEDR